MRDPLHHYGPGWREWCAHRRTTDPDYPICRGEKFVVFYAAQRFSAGISIILLNERLAEGDAVLRRRSQEGKGAVLHYPAPPTRNER